MSVWTAWILAEKRGLYAQPFVTSVQLWVGASAQMNGTLGVKAAQGESVLYLLHARGAASGTEANPVSEDKATSFPPWFTMLG